MPIARGRFHVRLTPLEPGEPGRAAGLGRLAIDKTFEGDLAATSVGEMLALQTAEAGSAGYVAIERVTGTLHGRRGGFALQHHGLMAGGEGRLRVEVVPGSGSGELLGLEGRMTIDVTGGEHVYQLEYTV